jgi:HAMP domain-containing protein
MAANLTGQVRNIAEVTTAVATGDLSKKITVDVRGEILELKNTINTMVDQLSSFASEVTRVAREVGTEGKLGGQALVKGVAGTWKDLTDNVNMMADNLTTQVRGIARVVTAVANGDLKRRLTVESKGEIAALTDTINEMNDTLATFAEQVTTVAREVGVEGKLGGQASVPGAAGTWRDLTDNVNQLAANLTTQVRAIAEVATAVTKGDLTRSITVVALGEVAVLKDNINEMIRNLRDTTQKNTEQDWLKTNLATFTRMLQGQKDLATVAKLILSELAPVVSAQHGAFYLMESTEGTPVLSLLSAYAYRARKNLSNQFRLGEGIVGQSALEKEPILLTEVPDDYVRINSGLGEAPPRNIVVLPVLFEGQVKAVVELGSLNLFSEIHLTFLQQLAEGIGIPAAQGGTGLPLPDEVVLDPAEVMAIRDRVNALNQVIRETCQAASVPVLDVHALLEEVTTRGREVGGVTLDEDFLTGGIFSYDGVHLTDLGYAVVANEWIGMINANGGKVPLVDLAPFLGVAAQGQRVRAASGGGVASSARVRLDPRAYAALLKVFPRLDGR